jgi:hypothetical protein
MGADLSGVRVHTDEKAAQSADAINARAYTLGNNVAFGANQYSPESESGRRLLGHELAHVMQQRESPDGGTIQRKIGDGHDLTSPRFSLLADLEAAYDGEGPVCLGNRGRGVQAIQHALYDLGFALPAHGADGDFKDETKLAVEAFQRANPPLADDGAVGENTMAALDARFGSPSLPPAADLSAPWTSACVLSVLCPWSPHTVDVLKGITLKSYDSITYADEEWDGSAWVAAPFIAGGFHNSSGIGVINTDCEEMAEILYHEILHEEQPTVHATTLQSESYAYRIGEEFSIALGLGGQPGLRSTDAGGREFADRSKVGTFVATNYPSVVAGGAAEQIAGKAATHGHVIVERADGTTYTRPAATGERVDGPKTVVNEVTQPTAGWSCP